MDEKNREILKGYYNKKADTEVASELSAVKNKQDSLVNTLNDIKSTLNSST
jgi:hypothetical protein